ncbi:MAG: hypothetical protein GY822_26185 [Deltaproteobacteria bacterium]|nr:hypothetical protein [Deltaproteobacteria bacterium]
MTATARVDWGGIVKCAGHFTEDVRLWLGATQGHEVIGLGKEDLKFEALGYDVTILANRLNGFGFDFAKQI